MGWDNDTVTVAADLAATIGLCVLALTTGSAWWWCLAAAWAVLTTFQLRLTIHVGADRSRGSRRTD